MQESDDVLVPTSGPDTPSLTWATDEILPPIVIPPEHLEPIRDRWMHPLVDRIAVLERNVGRLEARYAQARQALDAAIQERDQARVDGAVAALERDQIRAERDALLRTRATLRDQIRALERTVRSAQDTTALRAIEAYDLPRRRSLRSRQHKRRRWWRFWNRP